MNPPLLSRLALPARTAMQAAVLGLLLSACAWGAANRLGPAAAGREPPAIPRQSTGPDGTHYSPADLPLASTPAGELVISHLERYFSGDIVWTQCDGTGSYLVVPGGGPARALASGESACNAVRSYDVATDGTSAVYSTQGQPMHYGLVRLDLVTGRADTLPTGCRVYLRSPSISPDGRMIAAVGRCGSRDQEPDALYTLRADGSELREIAGGVAQGRAAWSPDARRLAYVRRGQGSRPMLVVSNADGTDARALTPGTHPAWSPDGRWIAFGRTNMGQEDRKIYLIRPDGTDRRLAFANPRRPFSHGLYNSPEGLPGGSIVWSPDSRWISFSRGYGAGVSVWRVEIETGRVEPVTRPGR